jgi:hypothetical protein
MAATPNPIMVSKRYVQYFWIIQVSIVRKCSDLIRLLQKKFGLVERISSSGKEGKSMLSSLL